MYVEIVIAYGLVFKGFQRRLIDNLFFQSIQALEIFDRVGEPFLGIIVDHIVWLKSNCVHSCCIEPFGPCERSRIPVFFGIR